MDAKQRLKILIDSSTPIVVIETLEEARALRLIQQAAGELQLPVFEWSIADGLSRSAKTATGTFQAVPRTSSANPWMPYRPTRLARTVSATFAQPPAGK